MLASPAKRARRAPDTDARNRRPAEAQAATAASTTGAVAGATLEVSLAAQLDESASARFGPATTRAGQDRQARASPPAAGRPRDQVPRGTCNRAPGSDASSTRNDTPSAAAVEHVLRARRHREARPARAPVTGSIVTGAARRFSMSPWSWPLGHWLGQTQPYWAVSGTPPATSSSEQAQARHATAGSSSRCAECWPEASSASTPPNWSTPASPAPGRSRSTCHESQRTQRAHRRPPRPCA